METVPAKILNDIARTQPLKTLGMQRLFRMTDQQKAEELANQYEALTSHGVPAVVAENYQEIAPLMMENVAISHYIAAKNDPSLRMLLPEICSVTEALRVADRNRPMTPPERLQLARLLVKLQSQSQGDAHSSSATTPLNNRQLAKLFLKRLDQYRAAKKAETSR